MIFSLFLIDVIVWIFYLSKGFLGAKIRAELDIWKNRNVIEEKFEELERKRIISDSEIIKIFSDKINVPQKVTSGNMNRLLNFVLERLSKRVRAKICDKAD